MDYPTSFGSSSLDVKSQEVKTFVDVGDFCLFFGQSQVKFRFKVLFDFLLGLLDSFDGVITDNDEIICVTYHFVVPASCIPNPVAFVGRTVPFLLCPFVKLIEIDIGEER